MPGGDGTGPMGMGPMTGRAAGYCAGYAVPGFMNPMPGRGFGGRGMGFGRGRGRGWRAAAWGYPAAAYAPAAAFPPYGAAAYAPPMTQEDELQALRTQSDYFASALEEIRKRIDELQAAQKQD
jgi:hypothetical protein